MLKICVSGYFFTITFGWRWKNDEPDQSTSSNCTEINLISSNNSNISTTFSTISSASSSRLRKSSTDSLSSAVSEDIKNEIGISNALILQNKSISQHEKISSFIPKKLTSKDKKKWW